MDKLGTNGQDILESSQNGAAHFHRLTGVAESQRAFDRAFNDKYVNPADNRVFSSEVILRACPLCGASGGSVLFVKNGFQHLRCTCTMIYVREILKKDFNLPYSGENAEQKTHESFRDPRRAAFIQSVYETGMGLLNGYGATGGKLLDIGCSSGMFLEYAKALGYDAMGVEPSSYASNMARKRGLQVICGQFLPGLFPEAVFDIVTLWDVLEHVENPLSFLSGVFRSLKQGGILFFQVPNVASLAATLLQEKCNMFNGYGHINLFSPETACMLITKAGFERPLMKTVITEFSVIENYSHFEDPYLGPSTGCRNLWGMVSPSALHQKLLGYKLQIAATKGVGI